MRPHDYPHLQHRWRQVASACGTRLRALACADGFRLYYLRMPALRSESGIYLSAGIHGDEAGATEGLLAWAQQKGRSLREIPLLIFPCLNPWGLRNNIRLDRAGNDLNRSFQRQDLPQLTALKAVLEPYRFEVALMLHEDYDAQGLYLYEIQRTFPAWGESLLAAGSKAMPLEPRHRVDRYRAVDGLIRRKFHQPRYLRMGYPEAIWLHLYHSKRTFTVETPSELALETRVAAHGTVLDEVLRLHGETQIIQCQASVESGN